MTLATLASRLTGCVVKSDTVLTALCPCCSKAMTVREENGEVRFKCYGRHCGQTEIEQALKEGGEQSESDKPDVATAPVEKARPGPSKPRSGSQTSPGAPSRRSHALAYTKYGIPVFPLHWLRQDGSCSCCKPECGSGGKHPIQSDWQEDATTNEAVIRAWWRKWPEANIGVACGERANLTVLDVDGDEGRAVLRGLELEHGELPETPIAVTGRGGAHYYFGFEAGLANAVKFAPGLDVRTEGGLVVGVGSATKQPYRWEAAFTLGSDGLVPAKMPGWLSELIRSASVPAQNGRLVLPAQIPDGERNNWLFKLTRSLKARGMGAQAIRLAVESENATRCLPPKTPRELQEIIDHALTAPDRKEFERSEDGQWAGTDNHDGRKQAQLPIPWEGFSAAVAANAAYLERTAVIAKLCYSSSVTMITGGKHAGKSTLARWMAICVAKGWEFLGRAVTQGPVFYVASEDETMAARQELIRLGWGESDPLRFLSAQNVPLDDLDAFLMRLTDEIKQAGAVMAVLDMLFDFVRIGDEMSYSGTREAVGKIQKVASASQSLLVTSHHAPKHASKMVDAAVTALGSQGLAARVSPIIFVTRHGPGVHSVVTTSVRDPRGEGLDNSRLTRAADGSLSLGGVWKDWMQAEVYKPQILEVLGAEEGQEMTAADLAEQVETTYRTVAAAASALYKEGKLTRSGSGKKGKPYRYSLAHSEISSANTDKIPDGSSTWEKKSVDFAPRQGGLGYKD